MWLLHVERDINYVNSLTSLFPSPDVQLLSPAYCDDWPLCIIWQAQSLLDIQSKQLLFDACFCCWYISRQPIHFNQFLEFVCECGECWNIVVFWMCRPYMVLLTDNPFKFNLCCLAFLACHFTTAVWCTINFSVSVQLGLNCKLKSSFISDFLNW